MKVHIPCLEGLGNNEMGSGMESWDVSYTDSIMSDARKLMKNPQNVWYRKVPRIITST